MSNCGVYIGYSACAAQGSNCCWNSATQYCDNSCYDDDDDNYNYVNPAAIWVPFMLFGIAIFIIILIRRNQIRNMYMRRGGNVTVIQSTPQPQYQQSYSTTSDYNNMNNMNNSYPNQQEQFTSGGYGGGQPYVQPPPQQQYYPPSDQASYNSGYGPGPVYGQNIPEATTFTTDPSTHKQQNDPYPPNNNPF